MNPIYVRMQQENRKEFYANEGEFSPELKQIDHYREHTYHTQPQYN